MEAYTHIAADLFPACSQTAEVTLDLRTNNAFETEDLWHLAALILIWNIHHPFRRRWKTERVRKSTQTHGGKIWPLWQQFRMRWGHISAQTPRKRHKNNQDSSLLSLAILNPRLVSSVRSSSGYHSLLHTSNPVFQNFQILQILKWKWKWKWKDPTCAIFLKSMGFKDIEYDIPVYQM